MNGAEDARSSTASDYSLLDVPDSLAGADRHRATPTAPDGDFTYDTIEVAFNKRFGRKFFVQTSVDYQWRNELRSADIPTSARPSPLSADPIGVFPQISVNPNAPEPSEDDGVRHCSCSGRYTFPSDIGVRRELPVPERLPVLAGRRRDGTRRT